MADNDLTLAEIKALMNSGELTKETQSKLNGRETALYVQALGDEAKKNGSYMDSTPFIPGASKLIDKGLSYFGNVSGGGGLSDLVPPMAKKAWNMTAPYMGGAAATAIGEKIGLPWWATWGAGHAAGDAAKFDMNPRSLGAAARRPGPTPLPPGQGELPLQGGASRGSPPLGEMPFTVQGYGPAPKMENPTQQKLLFNLERSGPGEGQGPSLPIPPPNLKELGNLTRPGPSGIVISPNGRSGDLTLRAPASSVFQKEKGPLRNYTGTDRAKLRESPNVSTTRNEDDVREQVTGSSRRGWADSRSQDPDYDPNSTTDGSKELQQKLRDALDKRTKRRTPK